MKSQRFIPIKQHKRSIKQDKRVLWRLRCKYCSEATIKQLGGEDKASLEKEDIEKIAEKLTKELQGSKVPADKADNLIKLIKKAVSVECDLHCVKLLLQTKKMQLEIDLGEV